MTKHRERDLALRILFAGLALNLFVGRLAPSAGGSTIQERIEANKELASILSVVQVKRNPELTMEPTVGRGGLLTSRDKKYYAYIFCVPVGSKEDPERCAHRVHFEENMRDARLYQIRGEPESEEVTRTVENLKWVNNYTLSYERWAGPHFGHRYLIDVPNRKVAVYDVTHGLTRIDKGNGPGMRQRGFACRSLSGSSLSLVPLNETCTRKKNLGGKTTWRSDLS